VTFEYFDNLDKFEGQGKLKQLTISAVEFIGRFLVHVFPSRFVRIRHFGLHHGSCRRKLQQARRLLGMIPQLPIIAKLKLLDWLKTILQTEQDPRLCPACQKGIMIPVREFGPVLGWRQRLLPLLGLLAQWNLAHP